MAGAGSQLSPLRLTEFRVTGAAAVLLPIVAAVTLGNRRAHRPARMTWDRRAVLVVVAYGLIAFVAVQSLYFVAIHRLPIGVALLIEYFAPALVALWVVFVQHRPQPRATWFGIALTLVGLALIARPWAGFALDGIGVAAALVAAAALAAYFLLAESAGERMPGLELCAWAATVGAAALALVLPWWSFPWRALARHAELAGHPTPVWLLLVLVVVVGTVIAYLTGIGALTYLPAPVVAAVATVEVVVASVTAWVLLDERLSTPEIVGGAVLLGGAVLAQRRSTGALRQAAVVEGIVTP